MRRPFYVLRTVAKAGFLASFALGAITIARAEEPPPVPLILTTEPDTAPPPGPGDKSKPTVKPSDAPPSTTIVEEPASPPPAPQTPFLTKIPRPGGFFIPPSGPGYYSLLDVLQDNERQATPKSPYPRFSICPFSFFDLDYSYLDNPDNQDHDWSDSLKRIHLGDNFLFTTGGEFRYRYINEMDSRLSGKDNVYQLTRTRVYGDLWYKDVARVYVEYIDAQTYNQDLPPLAIDANHSDLLNFFIDVKLFELDDHPVYFRGGRQEMLYGSQRLISPLDWANTRRTFQGGKVFYRGDNWDVDAFCVQPVVPTPNHFDSPDDNQIFSGAWATYRPKKGQAIDLYYLNLDQARHVAIGNRGVPGAFNVNTLGGRYSGDVDNRFLFDFEGAIQLGTWSNQSIFAQMGTAGLGYAFKDLPMDPQIWFYYDYASGDPNPGIGGEHRTFNQLFPFGHYYFGFIDVVGRQNIQDFNTQFVFYPTKWITSFAQYHIFELANAHDALYSAGAAALRRDPTGKAGTNVGQEIDLVTNFHLTNHQDVLIGFSHLFAGDFIQQTKPSARSPEYFYVQYSFRW